MESVSKTVLAYNGASCTLMTTLAESFAKLQINLHVIENMYSLAYLAQYDNVTIVTKDLALKTHYDAIYMFASKVADMTEYVNDKFAMSSALSKLYNVRYLSAGFFVHDTPERYLQFYVQPKRVWYGMVGQTFYLPKGKGFGAAMEQPPVTFDTRSKRVRVITDEEVHSSCVKAREYYPKREKLTK